ncbi:MAG: preprotein translocase subunit YajC [Cyanobacteria bacterium P01_F01_bin.153]
MDNFNLVMPLLIFGVIYFFMIRPQNKMRKEQEQFLADLEKGDEVVTGSGILGRVNKLDGDIVTLQVDTKTFIRVTKSAISKELTEQAVKTNEKVQQG